MNRIVLIGNGFDLAHGLKTRYEDFINWYWDQRLHGIILEHQAVSADELCSMKIYPTSGYDNWYLFSCGNSYFKNPFKNEWNITGREFIEELESKPDCFDIKYSPFLKNICKNIKTKGWVDIENEYYSLLERRIAQINNYTEKDVKYLNLQLDVLRYKLIEYLKQEQMKGVDIIDTIKEKIYRPIKLQEISVASKNLLDKSSLGDVNPIATMLLNFNYTQTPEQYITNQSNVKLIYIHGKINEPKSVIFGYGDELEDNYKKLQNLNENECLRHIKSIHYMESDNYRKVLEFIEADTFQIIIMGHSCGNSDRTLLNTLFEHRNCVSIKPYYYINDKGEDNYLELIQNISRNFTDMKLMRDRVVNKTYCETIS